MDYLYLVLTLIPFIIIVYYIFLWYIDRPFSKFDAKSKHCFITGGSSGLGLAICKRLVKEGADITIGKTLSVCNSSQVARRESLLIKVKEELEQFKVDEKQKIVTISADVTKWDDMNRAVKESELLHGRSIDYVFTCAGYSKPMYFHEQPIEDFFNAMNLNYIGTVMTIKSVLNTFIANKKKGHAKFIMISSTLGLMNLIGYSHYAPTKHALKSLAECLRQELRPFKVDVHIYFVGTIFTPGFEEESKTKPLITKQIEGDESPAYGSPEARADYLFKGLKSGYFAITSDFATDIFRVASMGMTPSHGISDLFMSIVSFVSHRNLSPLTLQFAVTPFRIYVDKCCSDLNFQ